MEAVVGLIGGSFQPHQLINGGVEAPLPFCNQPCRSSSASPHQGAALLLFWVARFLGDPEAAATCRCGGAAVVQRDGWNTERSAALFQACASPGEDAGAAETRLR